eukprot:UN05153
MSRSKRVMVLDGGMGIELKRRKVPYDLKLFSAKALIHAPEEVLRIHEDYIDAGCEVITTSCYACTKFYLQNSKKTKYNQSDLIKLSGELAFTARKNKNKNVIIAGCCPPLKESYQSHQVPCVSEMEEEY